MKISHEFQNIVTKYIEDDTIYVSKYHPYIFSRNTKPIDTRYYIFSRIKLTLDQCMAAVSLYEERFL